MKRLILIAAAASMALVSTAASAQSYGGYGNHNRDGYQRNYDRNDGRRGDRNDHYRGDRRDSHRGDRNHRWQRGAYMPQSYRSARYVRDYHRYGYRAPQRGYGYYRTDNGDVVLAAIATGLIISVIAGSNNNHGYNGYYGR